MSSGEDEYNDPKHSSSSLQGAKKRRIQRACDVCRRKKVRCDGGQMPGNRCSNCITCSLDCTYVEAAKKRGPPKGYVEGLENRLEKMDKLFRKLCPEIDINTEIDTLLDKDSWSPDRTQGNTPNASSRTTCIPASFSGSVIPGVGSHMTSDTTEDFLNDDDVAQLTLENKLKLLSIDPVHHRFFGKSSGAMLVQTAMELKKEYTGADDTAKIPFLGTQRPEFWKVHPWELQKSAEERPQFNFPDDDLMTSLVDCFFTNINIFFPLLHRPTFEKAIAEGLHLTNMFFAVNVLLVCANGARYSNDPRIFLDGSDSEHSCGWKWFEQVQIIPKSLLAAATLHELQFYSLSVIFLQGSSAPQSSWTLVGIGLRVAQDVGAHRRTVYDGKFTVESELWKRAFWVLVCMDRIVSSSLGRPCAIQDEDFDIDLPLECDDEFWEHPDPEMAFKQPPGKPSNIAYFNSFLKLNQVLAFSLRTIYSINKSKVLLGFVGQQWEQHIVTELDSALNKWIDSVPDHLRWDPDRQNDVFFDQSAALYTSYYHLQILVHRPFIPSPRNPSPLSFPSLAICTNAARSCSHVVDIQRRRSMRPIPHLQMAVFTAGIVLLLNIWGGKRSGLSCDPNKEMQDVHKCMQMLRACEQRWHSPGRLWDILFELASVGDLPLPHPSPPQTNKRERDAENPISATVNASSSTINVQPADGSRSIAGSQRVSTTKNMTSIPTPVIQQQSSSQSVPPTFTLPMYSDELGRLPLHHYFNSSNQVNPAFDPSPNYWNPIDPGDSNPADLSQRVPHTNAGGVADMPTSFPLDQGFYDQITVPFTNSYSQSSSANQPQYHRGDVEGSRSTAVKPGGHHHQAKYSSTVDNDTIAMWSNAPTGFELDDWGIYVTNVSESTH